ncbi:MAG: gliding motility lipoprotein GldH [Bacteroidetes bacterium]|nr:MAG: gliding motility lipoprotein GldH [Bacteroidota bacterium]
MKNLIPFLLVILLSLVSCNENVVYTEYQDLQDQAWIVDSVLSFGFEINDLQSDYNIDYGVRYAVDYPYYNLYVKFCLADATGKELTDWIRIDKNLMHPVTGAPFGNGLGDLFDIQFSALPNFKFDKKGKYYFKIRQDMRLDKLPAIAAVGVKVEKTNN